MDGLDVHSLEQVVRNPDGLRFSNEKRARDGRRGTLEAVEAGPSKSGELAGCAFPELLRIVHTRAADPFDAKPPKVPVLVACADKSNGGAHVAEVNGDVSLARPPAAARRRVFHEQRDLSRRRILDDVEPLLLGLACRTRNDWRAGGELTSRRQLLGQGGQEAIANFAWRQARQLAAQLGHVLGLKEHAAGVPGLRDAPIDVRVVLLGHERDACRPEILQDSPQRLGTLQPRGAGEVRLRPDAAPEERGQDGRDALRGAPLAHSRMLRDRGFAILRN